jgi:hypothetical protein
MEGKKNNSNEKSVSISSTQRVEESLAICEKGKESLAICEKGKESFTICLEGKESGRKYGKKLES